MQKIIFNADKMRGFLQDFQPMYVKYFGQNSVPSTYEESGLRSVFEQLNADDSYGGISSDELMSVYNIVEKVYGNTDTAKEYVSVYQDIQNKFIHEFVAIDGIEELYQPLFFVFEWLMHLEYKPEENSYSYYRDHFIHQVRNMFEMFRILLEDDMKILECCINVFEKGKTVLDIEMCKAAKDVIRTKRGMEKLEEATKELCADEAEEYCKKAAYRYILLASAVVTSLVHDIGYPVEFFSKNLGRMERFLPLSNYFFEMKQRTPELHIMLQESLLYKMVKPEKIAKRIGKGDHGAISACILLMKYYMNGKIHALPPVQKMVIELSAITIYEHTLRYEINEKEKNKHKADFYQNVFQDNPYSFLFRLCDDIEEWDRTYFDITKQSNFLVCDKCGTIISKWKIKEDFEKKENQEKVPRKIYSCCCGEKGYNENLFKYRKMAYINTCKTVTLKEMLGDDKNRLCYKITLDYDLASLLQATAYNEKFALKRAEALKEIKMMVFGQNGLEPFWVEAFVSNNPISIKTEIIRRYWKLKYSDKRDEFLNKVRNDETTDGIDGFLLVLKQIVENEYLDCLIGSDDVTKLVCASEKKVCSVLLENIAFYGKMMLITEYIECINRRIDKEERKQIVTRVCNILYKQENIFLDALKILIRDMVEQAFLRVTEDNFKENRWKVQEDYYNMCLSSEMVASAVRSYIKGPLYDYVRARCCEPKLVNEMNAIGVKEDACRYDFYSDFFVFQEMNKALNEKSEKSVIPERL